MNQGCPNIIYQRQMQEMSIFIATCDYIFCIRYICLFVCFVALRPKSTAMVMAGRSVHLTTLFPGKIEEAVNQYFVHILSLVLNCQQPFLNDSAQGRRMTV